MAQAFTLSSLAAPKPYSSSQLRERVRIRKELERFFTQIAGNSLPSSQLQPASVLVSNLNVHYLPSEKIIHCTNAAKGLIQVSTRGNQNLGQHTRVLPGTPSSQQAPS